MTTEVTEGKRGGKLMNDANNAEKPVERTRTSDEMLYKLLVAGGLRAIENLWSYYLQQMEHEAGAKRRNHDHP